MPPIRKIDEAFLANLLEGDEAIKDGILNNNVDSQSLSTVLTTLTTTSNALQHELFQLVHDNFDEFSTSYNTSQELYQSIFKLIKQVDTTEQQVNETKTIVIDSIESYQNALLASQNNQEKIDTLETLEQALDIMENIHLELKDSLYLEAVQHILKLQSILKAWQIDTRVKNLMEERLSNVQQKLVSHLQEDIRTAIQYNMGSMRILTHFKSNPNSTKSTHLQHVLQCLHELGLLPEELMGIQRLVFKNILNPYFENSTSHLQIDHVTIDEYSAGGVLQVIKYTHKEAEEEDERKLDPIVMLQHLDNILGFFFKYMFDNKKDQLNLVFGNILLPELENVMIKKGIAPAVPSTKYNLSDFDVIAQAVISFETKCTLDYGYQVKSEDATSLSLYVENIDKHYAKKRRERILQDGRKVMVRRLYDAEMTQVEEDGYTYRFQITQTPKILSVLISDTLDEAFQLLKSHPISATTLIEGIQDLLDMYRAIMPSYHRHQFLSGPATSLIFRNDCLWLAKQIKSVISMKQECKAFDTLATNLIEASNRLEELSNAWYEIAMMHRVQIIQSLLDQLDGFTGMAENVKFQQDCEEIISKVIQLVQSFATETQGVVDEVLFLDMLGRIVSSILERLIRDIEELADIGADESHVIAVTLNSFAQLVSTFDLPGKDATESFVSELVSCWEKFWLIKDILEMNMRDIMDMYRRGDLHMFEKSELIGLLCALFADTELRESNIQEIKTGRLSQQRSTVSPVHHQPIANLVNTTNTTNTSSPVSALDYNPDDDMDVGESGWGDDDDDDLFADEQVNIAPSSNVNSNTPPYNETITPPTISKSLQPSPSPLLDLDMDNMDDTDGGWGDADQDIFDENDILSETSNLDKKTDVPFTAISNNDRTAFVDSASSNTSSNTTTVDTALSNSANIASENIPSNSISVPNTVKPKATLSQVLDFQAIEDEIDNELNDGEGWGWDDDDDLFKDNK